MYNENRAFTFAKTEPWKAMGFVPKWLVNVWDLDGEGKKVVTSVQTQFNIYVASLLI